MLDFMTEPSVRILEIVILVHGQINRFRILLLVYYVCLQSLLYYLFISIHASPRRHMCGQFKFLDLSRLDDLLSIKCLHF